MDAGDAYALLIPPLAAALGALGALARSQAAINHKRLKDDNAAHAKLRRLEHVVTRAGYELPPLEDFARGELPQPKEARA